MEDEYDRNDLDRAHRDDAEDEKKAFEAPEADHHQSDHHEQHQWHRGGRRTGYFCSGLGATSPPAASSASASAPTATTRHTGSVTRAHHRRHAVESARNQSAGTSADQLNQQELSTLQGDNPSQINRMPAGREGNFSEYNAVRYRPDRRAARGASHKSPWYR
jgi:hypothetical protein